MQRDYHQGQKRTTRDAWPVLAVHSPPYRDPIFPTNGTRFTHDPEQYSKPERVSVMYVMPALPSLKNPRPTHLAPWAPQRLRTISREAAAGGGNGGVEGTTRVMMGGGGIKRNICMIMPL